MSFFRRLCLITAAIIDRGGCTRGQPQPPMLISDGGISTIRAPLYANLLPPSYRQADNSTDQK
jgi:hypothetical protein